MTTTAYGQITVLDTGWVQVTATQDELRAWAHRPGASWPCSTLARCASIEATFAPNGDLVDLESPGVDDIPADEFTSWADDVRVSS